MSWCASSRTGATAPKPAALWRCRISPGACAATSLRRRNRAAPGSKKSPPETGFFYFVMPADAGIQGILDPCLRRDDRANARSFEFGFLVDHVLARDRIEFPDLQLVRRGALVLVRRVEMAGAGGCFYLDFFPHSIPL